MLRQRNHWPRRLMALFCLLAVVLLQAPFARAAWFSSSMGCCMSDHCPIPGHHRKPAKASSEMPMDCGHNMSHLSDCKISCCKTADETAIDVAQFVMPAPQGGATLQKATPRVFQYASQMISRSEKPQSPPPKSSLA